MKKVLRIIALSALLVGTMEALSGPIPWNLPPSLSGPIPWNVPPAK